MGKEEAFETGIDVLAGLTQHDDRAKSGEVIAASDLDSSAEKTRTIH